MKVVNSYKGCQYRNVHMMPTKGVVYNETIVHEWRKQLVKPEPSVPGVSECTGPKVITKCVYCGLEADFSNKGYI